MKRLAVFVEGQTELYFVQKLIEEIAGYGKIKFDLKIMRAGVIHDLRSTGTPEEVSLMNIMIVDCGGDGSVKSAIKDRADRLAASGYSEIIGLLDLHPKPLDALPKFEAGLAAGLEDYKIKIRIFIAVKEIEAWFINEHTHFLKISPELTPDEIENVCGFNPESGHAEKEVNHPAGMLKKIYRSKGADYKKREADTFKMVANLDFCALYVSVKERSNSLSQLIAGIESFMGSATVSNAENEAPASMA